MPSELSIPMRIEPDVQGSARSCDGNTLELIATRAYPPGQPVQMTLLPEASTALSVAARSIGSKRRSDGDFDVRVRLVNLSRPTREALERLFQQS